MKALITGVMIAGISLLSTAQEVGNRIHDLLSNENGVISMSMNRSLDEVFDGEVDLEELGISISGNSDRVKVSILEDDNEDGEVAQRILEALYAEGLASISIKEDDNKVSLWLAEYDEPISELHLTISSSDGGLVYITVYGEFIVQRK